MSIVVETKYEGNYKSGIKTPLSDDPIAVNAARFNPVDLLAGAYGSCLLGTIDYECRKKQLADTTEARSEIVYEMTEDKTRIGTLHIKMFFENDYSDEQKQVIELAAKTQCHVGNSIDPAIKKQYEFFYNEK